MYEFRKYTAVSVGRTALFRGNIKAFPTPVMLLGIAHAAFPPRQCGACFSEGI
jgi:hypothetical protein